MHEHESRFLTSGGKSSIEAMVYNEPKANAERKSVNWGRE